MFVKKLIPFAVAASFAMAGATAFAKTEFVTIGTGGITGVYYPTGGAIAKIVNAKKDQYGVRASVESTGGSKFNINAIDSKDLDFGIAQADTQYMAYNGKGAWEGKPVKKLRAVFALAPWLPKTPTSSPLKTSRARPLTSVTRVPATALTPPTSSMPSASFQEKISVMKN